MSWLNPSGGLKYHLKALRFRRKYWQHHTFATRQWLDQWQPQSQHLVLLGPSAGYSISPSFLKKFQQITAIDPDPLSAQLFRLRTPQIKVQWSRQNYLFRNDKFLWPEGLLYLREEYPESAVLFCNLLGHLPLLVRPNQDLMAKWLLHWQVFLQNGEWASYHDLWSSPATLPPKSWPSSSASEDLAISVRHFTATPGACTVYDHMTKNLFPKNAERSQWLWQIEPGQVHCVEGVRPSKQVSGA